MSLTVLLVPRAGIEPAWNIIPGDFKSPASTNFATRAAGGLVYLKYYPQTSNTQYGLVQVESGRESGEQDRLINPLNRNFIVGVKYRHCLSTGAGSPYGSAQRRS